MKKANYASTIVAFIIATVGAYASTTLAAVRYEVIGQGGSGSSQYWKLDEDVTNQIPGAPGAYRCDASLNICTALADESDIIDIGAELVVLKSDATTVSGTFVDLP